MRVEAGERVRFEGLGGVGLGVMHSPVVMST